MKRSPAVFEPTPQCALTSEETPSAGSSHRQGKDDGFEKAYQQFLGNRGSGRNPHHVQRPRKDQPQQHDYNVNQDWHSNSTYDNSNTSWESDWSNTRGSSAKSESPGIGGGGGGAFYKYRNPASHPPEWSTSDIATTDTAPPGYGVMHNSQQSSSNSPSASSSSYYDSNDFYSGGYSYDQNLSGPGYQQPSYLGHHQQYQSMNNMRTCGDSGSYNGNRNPSSCPQTPVKQPAPDYSRRQTRYGMDTGLRTQIKREPEPERDNAEMDGENFTSLFTKSLTSLYSQDTENAYADDGNDPDIMICSPTSNMPPVEESSYQRMGGTSSQYHMGTSGYPGTRSNFGFYENRPQNCESTSNVEEANSEGERSNSFRYDRPSFDDMHLYASSPTESKSQAKKRKLSMPNIAAEGGNFQGGENRRKAPRLLSFKSDSKWTPNSFAFSDVQIKQEPLDDYGTEDLDNQNLGRLSFKDASPGSGGSGIKTPNQQQDHPKPVPRKRSPGATCFERFEKKSTSTNKKVSPLSVYAKVQDSIVLSVKCRRFKKRTKPIVAKDEVVYPGREEIENWKRSGAYNQSPDQAVRQLMNDLLERVSHCGDKYATDGQDLSQVDILKLQELIYQFCQRYSLDCRDFDDIQSVLKPCIIKDKTAKNSERASAIRKRTSISPVQPKPVTEPEVKAPKSEKTGKKTTTTEVPKPAERRVLRKLPGRADRGRQLRRRSGKTPVVRRRYSTRSTKDADEMNSDVDIIIDSSTDRESEAGKEAEVPKKSPRLRNKHPVIETPAKENNTEKAAVTKNSRNSIKREEPRTRSREKREVEKYKEPPKPATPKKKWSKLHIKYNENSQSSDSVEEIKTVSPARKNPSRETCKIEIKLEPLSPTKFTEKPSCKNPKVPEEVSNKGAPSRKAVEKNLSSFETSSQKSNISVRHTRRRSTEVSVIEILPKPFASSKEGEENKSSLKPKKQANEEPKATPPMKRDILAVELKKLHTTLTKDKSFKTIPKNSDTQSTAKVCENLNLSGTAQKFSNVPSTKTSASSHSKIPDNSPKEASTSGKSHDNPAKKPKAEKPNEKLPLKSTKRVASFHRPQSTLQIKLTKLTMDGSDPRNNFLRFENFEKNIRKKTTASVTSKAAKNDDLLEDSSLGKPPQLVCMKESKKDHKEGIKGSEEDCSSDKSPKNDAPSPPLPKLVLRDEPSPEATATEDNTESASPTSPPTSTNEETTPSTSDSSPPETSATNIFATTTATAVAISPFSTVAVAVTTSAFIATINTPSAAAPSSIVSSSAETVSNNTSSPSTSLDTSTTPLASTPKESITLSEVSCRPRSIIPHRYSIESEDSDCGLVIDLDRRQSTEEPVLSPTFQNDIGEPNRANESEQTLDLVLKGELITPPSTSSENSRMSNGAVSGQTHEEDKPEALQPPDLASSSSRELDIVEPTRPLERSSSAFSLIDITDDDQVERARERDRDESILRTLLLETGDVTSVAAQDIVTQQHAVAAAAISDDSKNTINQDVMKLLMYQSYHESSPCCPSPSFDEKKIPLEQLATDVNANLLNDTDDMRDPLHIRDKIKKLKNEIVYLQCMVDQKDKERTAIVCFKRYKEEVLRRLIKEYAFNVQDHVRDWIKSRQENNCSESRSSSNRQKASSTASSSASSSHAAASASSQTATASSNTTSTSYLASSSSSAETPHPGMSPSHQVIQLAYHATVETDVPTATIANASGRSSTQVGENLPTVATMIAKATENYGVDMRTMRNGTTTTTQTILQKVLSSKEAVYSPTACRSPSTDRMSNGKASTHQQQQSVQIFQKTFSSSRESSFSPSHSRSPTLPELHPAAKPSTSSSHPQILQKVLSSKDLSYSPSSSRSPPSLQPELRSSAVKFSSQPCTSQIPPPPQYPLDLIVNHEKSEAPSKSFELVPSSSSKAGNENPKYNSTASSPKHTSYSAWSSVQSRRSMSATATTIDFRTEHSRTHDSLLSKRGPSVGAHSSSSQGFMVVPPPTTLQQSQKSSFRSRGHHSRSENAHHHERSLKSSVERIYSRKTEEERRGLSYSSPAASNSSSSSATPYGGHIVRNSTTSSTVSRAPLSLSLSSSSSIHSSRPPKCMGCNLADAKFLCSGCRKHWYCSAQCQTLRWPEHAQMCTPCAYNPGPGPSYS